MAPRRLLLLHLAAAVAVPSILAAGASLVEAAPLPSPHDVVSATAAARRAGAPRRASTGATADDDVAADVFRIAARRLDTLSPSGSVASPPCNDNADRVLEDVILLIAVAAVIYVCCCRGEYVNDGDEELPAADDHPRQALEEKPVAPTRPARDDDDDSSSDTKATTAMAC